MGIYSKYANAQVVWPIMHEDIRKKDAIETLLAFEACMLSATKYAEDGTNYSEEIYIDLGCMETSHIFFRQSLYDLLREEYDPCPENYLNDLNGEFGVPKYEPPTEENKVNYARSYRLLIRLLRAYEEWKATDAKLSYDELKANPLPAIKDAK